MVKLKMIRGEKNVYSEKLIGPSSQKDRFCDLLLIIFVCLQKNYAAKINQ
jgi:hypothetical protein